MIECYKSPVFAGLFFSVTANVAVTIPVIIAANVAVIIPVIIAATIPVIIAATLAVTPYLPRYIWCSFIYNQRYI